MELVAYGHTHVEVKIKEFDCSEDYSSIIVSENIYYPVQLI